MIKKILIIAITLVSFAACKKDKNTPSNTTSNNTGAPPADGSQSYANTFSGVFSLGSYTTQFGSSTTYTNLSARVFFSSVPTQYMYAPNAIPVNKLYLNNDSLQYYPSSKYYYSLSTINPASETWSVSGANGIASFSFTNNASFPSFTIPSNVPDSISKSSGFSININNLNNSQEANFYVMDSTGSVNGFISKTLANGNNNVSITTADLNGLTPCLIGYISIVLKNSKAYYFSSKSYQFVREAQYNKQIKIKS